jgi:hypothetical protein
MRDLEKMLPLHLHLDEKQLDLDINMSVSYIFCAFMILAVSPVLVFYWLLVLGSQFFKFE